MALNRDLIVRTALAVMDEGGLDEFSTRRVAALLGVKQPALYKHFRNKAEMLDEMAVELLKSRFDSLDRSVPWDTWLQQLSHEARAGVLSHRDGAKLLIASSASSPPRVKLAATLSEPLRRDGFTPDSARFALAVMASFVSGWTLNEQAGADRELMAFGRKSQDAAFSEAVDVVLNGLCQLAGEDD